MTQELAAQESGGSNPASLARGLTPEQLRRYSRHVLLPEVRLKGQERLRASKVLIVGAGGLGSPISLYLAAAGVGEIGLVDFDWVDVSNLQRQVLYVTSDVGQPKLEAARARLHALNPELQITLHAGPLTSENARSILSPYDVVIDGTDNFPTRYLVNDACVLLGKPNVYGSIYRFEGQASVFDARRGPCYRCLYPEPPPPGSVPSCAEGGVLGVLPGTIGLIQATETVKLLLEIGTPLIGRLLLYDALTMQFRELALRKSPECVICSAHPSQTDLIDYPAFCGVEAEDPTSPTDGLPLISPQELEARLARPSPPLLLDVREPGEWEIAHLPNAVLIPREELPQRISELTQAEEIVVYCKSGRRSGMATRLLLDLGFTHVRNLRGGLDAWTAEIDPTLPTY
ncbi:MAG: molybdopterin-synthase adenylyltransferase MoeB [Thermoplasmata archaeon]|nr:molybdopterin-synthase adenylyltransferase MoeB [Thermoplasmata archaeon]